VRLVVVPDIPSPPYAGHVRGDADSSADDAVADADDHGHRQSDGHVEDHDAPSGGADVSVAMVDSDADAAAGDANCALAFQAAGGAEVSGVTCADASAGHADAGACADAATYAVAAAVVVAVVAAVDVADAGAAVAGAVGS